jgi:hypothetical protein
MLRGSCQSLVIINKVNKVLIVVGFLRKIVSSVQGYGHDNFHAC